MPLFCAHCRVIGRLAERQQINDPQSLSGDPTETTMVYFVMMGAYSMPGCPGQPGDDNRELHLSLHAAENPKVV
jgi:hypothetical protein